MSETDLGPEAIAGFLQGALKEFGFKVPLRVALVASNYAALVGRHCMSFSRRARRCPKLYVVHQE